MVSGGGEGVQLDIAPPINHGTLFCFCPPDKPKYLQNFAHHVFLFRGEHIGFSGFCLNLIFGLVF